MIITEWSFSQCLVLYQSGYNSKNKNHSKSLNRGNFMQGILMQVMEHMRNSNTNISNCKNLLTLLQLVMKERVNLTWKKKLKTPKRSWYTMGLFRKRKGCREDATLAKAARRKPWQLSFPWPHPLSHQGIRLTKKIFKNVKIQVTWKPRNTVYKTDHYPIWEPKREINQFKIKISQGLEQENIIWSRHIKSSDRWV